MDSRNSVDIEKPKEKTMNDQVNKSNVLSKKRNGLIDFYRFIFSMVVVFHHAMWLDGAVDIETQVLFLGGYSAVEFFFILSGFFLAKKAYDIQTDVDVGKRTWNEIINRVKALYPTFIIAFIISFSINHHFNGGNAVDKFSAAIGELTLLVGVGFNFGNGTFVGPIWYLSDLLIAILVLFPLMVKYKDKFTTIIAPLIAIFGYGYLAMSFRQLANTTEQIGIICGGTLRGCCGVALGSVVYHLSLKKTNCTRIGQMLLRVIGFSCFVLTLFSLDKHHGDYFDYVKVMLFAILILMAAKYGNNTIFNNKLVYILGEYSATLYVVHTCFLQIPKRLWPETWEMQYFMWMVMANVLAVLVFLFTKFVYPQISQAIKNILILKTDNTDK